MTLIAIRSLREPCLPPAPALGRWVDVPLGIALALFGFFLPFSVAGVSIMLAVLALLSLACAPSVLRTAPWRDPVVAVGLLLFAYLVGQTLAFSGTGPEGRSAINRYHELLMAPVLMALFRLTSNPKAFLHGLIAGTVLYAVAHWLSPLWPALGGKILSRSIGAGLILALMAYVLHDMARSSRYGHVLNILAAFLAFTVLMRVQGRTGQVILAFLVVYAIWPRVKRGWRFAAAIIAPLILITIALLFGAASERLEETRAGLRGSPDTAGTSTGFRLKMLQNALDMAQPHFLTGVGIGRYATVSEAYSKERAMRETAKVGIPQPWIATNNPHNEYLMQLVGAGVIALFLFLLWLALPFLRLRDGKPVPVLIAATGAFAIGCLFNSMLLDFTEGHFFVALMTWLLSGTTVNRQMPFLASADA